MSSNILIMVLSFAAAIAYRLLMDMKRTKTICGIGVSWTRKLERDLKKYHNLDAEKEITNVIENFFKNHPIQS